MKMRPTHLQFLALALFALSTTATPAADVIASRPAAVAPAGSAAAATKQVAQTAAQTAALQAVRADNKRLRAQLKDLSNQMVEMDKRTPSCATDGGFVNPTISVTKSGIRTNCYPRACNPETGLCVPQPVTSNDCSPDSNWDGTTNRCITQAGGSMPGYHAEPVDQYTVFWVNDNHDCGPNHQWDRGQKGCVPKIVAVAPSASGH